MAADPPDLSNLGQISHSRQKTNWVSNHNLHATEATLLAVSALANVKLQCRHPLSKDLLAERVRRAHITQQNEDVKIAVHFSTPHIVLVYLVQVIIAMKMHLPRLTNRI